MAQAKIISIEYSVIENGITYRVLKTDNSLFFYQPNSTILHREDDQPAAEYSNGDKEWWINDQRHRVNGPAFIGKKSKEWWYHGIRAKVKSQREFKKWLKLQVFK